jgi:hypothetical protein
MGMRALITCTIVGFALLAAGCGLEGANLGKHGYAGSTLAITNAEGEDDVLRTGTAVNLATPTDVRLAANTIYTVLVKNIRTGSLVAQTDVLTDMGGTLQRTSVAHDLGEFDDVQDEDDLSLVVMGPDQEMIVDQTIPVTPHIPDFQGHGFQVDEVQPAHVMSCDPNGSPVNGFVVGALPDPGETGAPIYVSGRGFAKNVTTVDIYVVKDRDSWQGRTLPALGDADYVAGPIVGTVQDGGLAPTNTGWQPTGAEVGPYDILVDVDRNGRFDYSFTVKDASDGEDKVGLTIQYGAAWLRAKNATDAAETSAQAAAKAYAAADAAATTAENQAKGPDALALAAQARAEADAAKSESQSAANAAAAAKTSFNQTLADAVTCQAQSSTADAAAKKAADHATTAAQLVQDTAQATAAWEAKMKALAAQMASKHLLVNLAYSSASRTAGTWENSYSQSAEIYSYVNPPVQTGARHAWVNKLVIHHQSWTGFWNNWELVQQGGKGVGRILISDLVVKALGGSIQKSCTNAPPVKIINPADLPLDTVNVLKYDIVFDYDNDGYYDIGRDFLDVVAHRTDGSLVSANDLANLPDDQIYGFQVTK